MSTTTWKNELLDWLPEVFAIGASDRSGWDKAERDRARRERKVGQLVTEKEFLEKSAWSSGSI